MSNLNNIDPKRIPLTLKQALDLLPEENSEGWYFELRKMRGWGWKDGERVTTQWVCAKTHVRDNVDGFNNIGATPVEAVYKMLLRLNIVERYDADPDDVPF